MIDVTRDGTHSFTGRNDRGAEVRIGRKGDPGSFSPVELLLVAAAGCAAVTAEELVTRRAGDDVRFRVTAADVRPPDAPQLDAVDLAFDLDLSGVDPETQEQIRLLIDRAVNALCTVTRTLKKETPVHMTLP